MSMPLGGDLLYEPKFKGVIRDAFPEATFEDDHDRIKGHRIEITIPDGRSKAFYLHAIEHGYAPALLAFQLWLRTKPNEVRELMEEAGVWPPAERESEE